MHKGRVMRKGKQCDQKDGGLSIWMPLELVTLFETACANAELLPDQIYNRDTSVCSMMMADAHWIYQEMPAPQDGIYTTHPDEGCATPLSRKSAS